MAFPTYETVEFGNPKRIRIRFRTLKSDFGEKGRIQRKRKQLFPRRDVTLVYQWISLSEAETLWKHFLSMYGAYGTDWFFDIEPHSYVREYVGSGDGSQQVWNLPSKDASSYSVYIDGVEQTSGVNYVIEASAGTDGQDKITFTVPPSAGALITYSFTGCLVIRCSYKEDYFDFETFYNRLVTTGIELEGELNA